MKRTCLPIVLFAIAVVCPVCAPAHAYGLKDAVAEAVRTNPLISEAAANRRAIDAEIDQAQGAYLPRLDLQANVGPQWVDRPNSLSTGNNREWRAARQASLVGTQVLFDGFFRANEVYRQAARVNGAALRVLERAEVVALDAIEAYVDLLRHRAILALADRNIREHREIVARIRDLAESGTATDGDVQQAEERLFGAEAARADVLRAIGDVEARYRAVIGDQPRRRMNPARIPTPIPASKAAAVAAARSDNPSLLAAGADIETAEAEFDQTKSLFLPTIGLEGRASAGYDLDGTPGVNNELAARVTLSWNLFNGGIDVARKRERLQRVTEAEMRRDRLRRDVDAAAERSFTDVAANDVRLSALRRQVQSSREVRESYIEEFDAGLRSLLDLLDAESALFNSSVQLRSAEAIAIFSRYQLIASTGRLLDHLGIAAPVDARVDPTDRRYRPVGGLAIEPLRKW